jgi:ABC-2 type transport system permease protein
MFILPIWTLAKKELRLLVRDRLAALILLGMPLVFIFLLGLLVGEGFGQKADERLRVSVLDLDRGYLDPAPIRDGLTWLAVTPTSAGASLPVRVAGAAAVRTAGEDAARQRAVSEGFAWLMRTPGLDAFPGGMDAREASALATALFQHRRRVLPPSWAHSVLRDLEQTTEIRVEIIHSMDEAQELVRDGKRAAILVFGPNFSERVAQCSFLADGINPFFRDGVLLTELDAQVLSDPTQITAASIIEQVAQVTLLRVILPWMIGRAFEKLSDPTFIDLLASEVRLPVPVLGKVPLQRLLTQPEHKEAVGIGVQRSLRGLFPRYELTGKTWAALTKSQPAAEKGDRAADFVDESGHGVLRRGAARYQLIVPSLTVMFAFSLMLTVGWLFVAERRQGTLRRLQAAPVTRGQILVGKLLPCLLVSVVQGIFLLVAGKLLFGMRWGPDSWSLAHQALWLLPVVVCTSLAAMGLAILVAVLARTEIQVAISGTLLVLLLALVSGCLLPRALMPEGLRQLSLVTPHAWALDAYTQLLISPDPNLSLVVQACAVLAAFGVGFVNLAWWFLRLD